MEESKKTTEAAKKTFGEVFQIIYDFLNKKEEEKKSGATATAASAGGPDEKKESEEILLQALNKYYSGINKMNDGYELVSAWETLFQIKERLSNPDTSSLGKFFIQTAKAIDLRMDSFSHEFKNELNEEFIDWPDVFKKTKAKFPIETSSREERRHQHEHEHGNGVSEEKMKELLKKQKEDLLRDMPAAQAPEVKGLGAIRVMLAFCLIGIGIIVYNILHPLNPDTSEMRKAVKEAVDSTVVANAKAIVKVMGPKVDSVSCVANAVNDNVFTLMKANSKLQDAQPLIPDDFRAGGKEKKR